MIAVFTSLKPFVGAAAEIQRRTLDNWNSCFPDSRIVTFEGPLVPFSEMVEKVERETDAEILMYANGDVLFEEGNVLTQRCEGAEILSREGEFLMTGQRIDILADGMKRLHRPSGMDYFVFRRGMFRDLPRVLMGRAYCDSALVAHCLRKRIPVIDGSFAVRVEHQFHDYGHVEGGRKTVWTGDAALQNLEKNCLRAFAPHCIDATQTLLDDGRVVPNIRASLLRRLETELFYRRGWRWCPPFNAWWNLLTRGGKWWKNPRWEGVRAV